MALSDEQLLAKSRSTYELGRVGFGVRESWPVPLVAAIAFSQHRLTLATLAGCVALAIVGPLLVWRGQEFRRAWWAGLVASVAPLVLPALIPLDCVCALGGLCFSYCLVGCAVGGVVAGVVIGAFVGREPRSRALLAIAASAVTVFVGAFGCALAGVAGVLGMMAGAAVAVVPAYRRFAAGRLT